MRSCSTGSRPTRATPSRIAVTAGTAPAPRIAAMQRSSASALAGDGRPRLEKIVDSRATTASPSVDRRAHLVGDLWRQHPSVSVARRTGTPLRCAWCAGTCRSAPTARWTIAGLAEQLGVATERAGVAADEHEHGSSEAGEGGASRRPQTAARRIGDDHLGAEVGRRPPTTDLAANELMASIARGSAPASAIADRDVSMATT